jgi:outer membrane protein TolC
MKTIFLILNCVIVTTLNSLTQDSIQVQISKDSLHPISYYLESAVSNSPILKMHTAQVDQKKLELDLLKYAWMREIFFTADTKLGNYGNVNPVDQFNLGYGTGAFIRLPITAFIGSNERKKIAKLDIDASSYQRLAIEEELKKLVINQYNEVLLKRNLIKIQVEAVDVALVNYKIAQEEYMGGTINIDAFSRSSQIYFTQLSVLERTKFEYKTAFELLIEICGNN